MSRPAHTSPGLYLAQLRTLGYLNYCNAGGLVEESLAIRLRLALCFSPSDVSPLPVV
jgi:hypothetical protein